MLRVRVFGGLALESGGTALDPPAGRRARELLGWLALHPGRHARAAVAARFWPDVLDASARGSLRTTLHELRRALGPHGGCLVSDRDAVGLEGVWVDARELDALVAAGRAEDALALRDGELLAGLESDWVLAERDALRERLAAGPRAAAGAPPAAVRARRRGRRDGPVRALLRGGDRPLPGVRRGARRRLAARDAGRRRRRGGRA